MNSLFPSGYENETIEASEIATSGPVGYRRGAAFDDATGEFLRDGMNRIMDGTGVDAWKNWCSNCIRTERYACLAYSTDFGIETTPAIRATSREEAESVLTRQITEAILADPYGRAEYVEDIAFNWTAADEVEVHAVVRGIDDVTIDVTAALSGAD